MDHRSKASNGVKPYCAPARPLPPVTSSPPGRSPASSIRGDRCIWGRKNNWECQTSNHQLVGTIRLLEFCRRTGVPHFVFASSSSVYGKETPLSAGETTPANPCSPYVLTKLHGGVGRDGLGAPTLVRPDGRRESTAHRQPMTSHPRGQSGSAEAVRPYRPPARLALPRPAVPLGLGTGTAVRSCPGIRGCGVPPQAVDGASRAVNSHHSAPRPHPRCGRGPGGRTGPPLAGPRRGGPERRHRPKPLRPGHA
ncbi:MAG: GDP-mannose 4,6-dehydratase, partial [Verrucomicrobia bacterium]|nr:GDP-mannose 4,6-dehydratase [Verrucomicrobiota bacterium]